MNTILLSESKAASELVRSVLAVNKDYDLIYEATSLTELMTAQVVQPELMILCITSPDQQLLMQLKLVEERFPLPIIIFTEIEGSHAIESAIEAGVSAYVVDGLSESRLLPIIRTAIARFKHSLSMQKELNKLRITLSERKIIDRAKGIIMAQKKCTEEEAYSLLRTTAMNQNSRLALLAQNIIDTAGLLGSASR